MDNPEKIGKLIKSDVKRSDAVESVKPSIQVPDEILSRARVYNKSAGNSSYNLMTDVTIEERAISKRFTTNTKIFSKPGPSRETMILPPGWKNPRVASRQVDPSLDVITLNDTDDVDWKARMKYTRKNLQSKLSKKTNFPTARQSQFANRDVVEIDVDEKAPVNQTIVFNKENMNCYNNTSNVNAIQKRKVDIPKKSSKFSNFFPPTTADEKSLRIGKRIRSQTMTPFPDGPAIHGEKKQHICKSEDSLCSSLPSGTIIKKRKVNYVREVNSVYPNLDNRTDYSTYPLLNREKNVDMPMIPKEAMLVDRTDKEIREKNCGEKYSTTRNTRFE